MGRPLAAINRRARHALYSGSQAAAWEPAWVQSSALLKTGNRGGDILVAKRSLAPVRVPKLELGDKLRLVAGGEARPTDFPWFSRFRAQLGNQNLRRAVD